MPRKKITLGQFLETLSKPASFDVWYKFRSPGNPVNGGPARSWGSTKKRSSTLKVQDELGSEGTVELLISDYVVTRIGYQRSVSRLCIDVEERSKHAE